MRHEERGAFLDLMEVAFGERLHFTRYLEHDPCLGDEDTLVAAEGDRLVASVQIFSRRLRLGAAELMLGGIGSVATHPEREREGIATRLLHRAAREMKRRGMALSLLFTTRTSFYERLDWHRIDHPMLVLPEGGNRGAFRGQREFEMGDLARITELYRQYSESRPLAVLRDEPYWRAQLVFAGQPDESFRVAIHQRRIVAYARRIRQETIHRVMEFGRESDDRGPAADALAGLLIAMTPDDGPLFVPDTHDPALLAALEARLGETLDRVGFPDQMWRVLDVDALRALAPDAGEGSDRLLLEALVARPGCVFWASDRF